MHEWLVAITNGTVLVIDAIVLVIIAVGTFQAFVQGLRVMLLPSASGHERRDVWLHYARWLVARRLFPARRRYPCDLDRSELGRAGAPRDRRSDLNFAQLLPRERSRRGSQTANRACRWQVYFRLISTQERTCSIVDIASFAPPFERRCARQLQAAGQELVGLAGMGWSQSLCDWFHSSAVHFRRVLLKPPHPGFVIVT